MSEYHTCDVCGKSTGAMLGRHGRPRKRCSEECRREAARRTSRKYYKNNREHHLQVVSVYDKRPEVADRRNARFKERLDTEPGFRERRNLNARNYERRKRAIAAGSAGTSAAAPVS